MTATRRADVELRQLGKLSRANRADAEREKRSREARDEAIRALLADGVPRSEIIAASGLSPARVEQIRRSTR